MTKSKWSRDWKNSSIVKHSSLPVESKKSKVDTNNWNNLGYTRGQVITNKFTGESGVIKDIISGDRPGTVVTYEVRVANIYTLYWRSDEVIPYLTD